MGWGGQEIRTLTEAAGLHRAAGHRVVVYARCAIAHPRRGAALRRADRRAADRRASGCAACGRCRRVLSARPVDVVNAHSSTDAGSPRSPARGCGATRRRRRSSCARATCRSACPTTARRAGSTACDAARVVTTGDGAARAADPRQRPRPRARRFGADRHRRRTRSQPASRAAARAIGCGLPPDAALLIGIVATLRSWKGHRYPGRCAAAAARTATRDSSSSATGRSAPRSRRRSTRSGSRERVTFAGQQPTSRPGSPRSTCSCCRPMPTKAFRRRCCRRCSPACRA